MKRFLLNIHSAWILLAIFAFGSCDKDDRDINLNLSEVTAFYAPNDNLFVKLEPATAASVGFEWEQAKAEDGSLVMYEVAFDEEGGDFSEPLYKISSDGNGIQNRLTLSHKDLNRIANFAGIPALETGKLIWTVMASKGTNVKKAALTRTIEVERPAGFAELPTEVYITGEGTEAGADAASAPERADLRHPLPALPGNAAPAVPAAVVPAPRLLPRGGRRALPAVRVPAVRPRARRAHARGGARPPARPAARALCDPACDERVDRARDASRGRQRRQGHHHTARHGHHTGRGGPFVFADNALCAAAIGRRDGGFEIPQKGDDRDVRFRRQIGRAHV